MNSDTIILGLLLLTATTNGLISAYGIWSRRGIGRVLASVPLIGFLGMALHVGVGVSRNPSSHNLWPFEMIATGAAGVFFSVGLLGLETICHWSKCRCR